MNDKVETPVEIRIPPFWWIMSPESTSGMPLEGDGHRIRLCSGEGWGTGAHETTQLCLQAIALLSPRQAGGFRMLDFGSGSGLLSIGAAQLGATVEAVEIDPVAIEHARTNARLNGVEHSIQFSEEIQCEAGSCDLVVANILRPILLQYATALVSCLKPSGVLVLSGLVATDIPELSTRYSALLGGRQPEVYRRGEWRALVWRAG